MKKIFVLFLLTGCATSVKSIRGPNGTAAFSITCKNSVDNCYEAAANQCPSGYNIIQQSDQGTTYAPLMGTVVAQKKMNMFIECK